MFYNSSPFETNALMRSPNGDITTQFELHDSDLMGDVKYDILLTSISSKIKTCLSLLQQDGLIEKDMSLREIYNKYLHPEYMNFDREDIWSALSNGEVMDVFQFNDGVGLATAKLIKPTDVMQMTISNALMRLQGEKGKERPADRYARLKNDMTQWYSEVRNDWRLSEQEVKILEPYYLPRFGTPCAQEDMMRICMDKNISDFTLSESNECRKIVGKKIIKKVPALKEKFLNACPNKNFGEYVWETTMMPQMSYAFNLGHGLAYSFVGIQTLYLAKTFPSIYWNCACLIINAGGADLLNADDTDSDIDETQEKDKNKKKNKTVDYGKISIALGKSKKANINVMPPDINKSSLIFSPFAEQETIIYGFKGIDHIGTALIYEIISNRPYNSIEDFLTKVKVNKTQMISLIKSGAFDDLYHDRAIAMDAYLNLIADKKKRITLQNMKMLMEKHMIPEHLTIEGQIYNFNKYLKQYAKDNVYELNNIAFNFFIQHFDQDLLINVKIDENGTCGEIKQTVWDKLYQKAMNPIREWMKEKQSTILEELNGKLYTEIEQKYAQGDINKWDMDSLGTYCHEHELKKLRKDVYGISVFENLDEEPQIATELTTKDGSIIRLYDITRVCGTIINKDKNKSTITILTPEMEVVSVKVWKNQYAEWDRQLSRRNPDGTKTVVEKSFFARGNKIIITGIRRGDDFVPKKYKSTKYPLFEKIISMDDDGFITQSATERIKLEDE